ncbi:heparan-alpha-glucosaminide N-acetyltransferase domain-containing protein, partial [Rhizobium ruizarguesonis]
YVPLFPWAVPFFAGLSIASIAIRTMLPQRLAALGTGSWWPARLGRHSLAFYLIHQPVNKYYSITELTREFGVSTRK